MITDGSTGAADDLVYALVSVLLPFFAALGALVVVLALIREVAR